MLQLASGVSQLAGFPRHQINVHLVENILVDAGTVAARRRIVRQVRCLDLVANLITHAHPNHFGSSHAICTRLGIPLWAGALDRGAIETAIPTTGEGRMARLTGRFPLAPSHPVSRELEEGDEVAGFTVLHVPGHSPGHLALWRESDAVLLCGDVFFNIRRLGPPPNFLTWSPEVNRQFMRRLADLQPRLVIFGPGAPASCSPSERMPFETDAGRATSWRRAEGKHPHSQRTVAFRVAASFVQPGFNLEVRPSSLSFLHRVSLRPGFPDGQLVSLSAPCGTA